MVQSSQKLQTSIKKHIGHPMLPFTIMQFIFLGLGLWFSQKVLKSANNVPSTLVYTTSFKCNPSCSLQKKMWGLADTLIAFYVYAILFFTLYAFSRHFKETSKNLATLANKKGAQIQQFGVKKLNQYKSSEGTMTGYRWLIIFLKFMLIVGIPAIITIFVFVDFIHNVRYGYQHMYDESVTTTIAPSTSSTSSTDLAKTAYIWCIVAFSFFIINIAFFILYIILLLWFGMSIW